VFTVGAAEVYRMIRFRDRLRSSEEDRRRYEVCKRALASQEWDSVQDYADAKSEIVEETLANASATP
jgi:GrpB-like predicted nucleotidyltransferase (UPF0157 family)